MVVRSKDLRGSPALMGRGRDTIGEYHNHTVHMLGTVVQTGQDSGVDVLEGQIHKCQALPELWLRGDVIVAESVLKDRGRQVDIVPLPARFPGLRFRERHDRHIGAGMRVTNAGVPGHRNIKWNKQVTDKSNHRPEVFANCRQYGLRTVDQENYINGNLAVLGSRRRRRLCRRRLNCRRGWRRRCSARRRCWRNARRKCVAARARAPRGHLGVAGAGITQQAADLRIGVRHARG